MNDTLLLAFTTLVEVVAAEEEEEAAAAAARRQRAFLATLAQGMQTELEEVTPSRSWGGCRLLQPTRPGLPTPSHNFALAMS